MHSFRIPFSLLGVFLLLINLALTGPLAGQDVAIVAAASSSDTDPRFTDPQAKLLATGQFQSVDIINATNITPTLAELMLYDAVLVWTNFSFADGVAMGDVLADYVDAGGGVVVAVFANSTATVNRYLDGRWITGGYEVIPSQSGTASGSSGLGSILVSGHPVLSGVNAFNGGSSSFRPVTTFVTSGSTRVAEWTDGSTLVAEGASSNRVDLGFYPPSDVASSGFWNSSTDGDLLMANALTYVSGGGDLTLSNPIPGVAGVNNSVSFSNATSLGNVAIAFGFAPGATSANVVCPGVDIDIQSALLGGIFSADMNGSGSGSGFVPPGLSGQTIYVQALDLSSCTKSNLVVYTFP